jgi:HEAT repeat protein
MKTNLLWGSALAGLLVFSLAGAARADGVVLRASTLKQKDRATLKVEVQKLRAKNSQIFAKVARAPKIAVEMDEARRGSMTSISLPLSALGKDALFPMLEMLALDGPPRGKMTEGAWFALRVGLIEAVGMTRDTRATPVLNAILMNETEFFLVRAAAEALGRIGDDVSVKTLVRLASSPNAKQAAVLSALGECRRVGAANALAKVATTKDEAVARVVIKSLGAVGNAWAWKTPAVAESGEGDQVRAIAARALIQAFVQNDGYTRQKAQSALLVVNDPSTPSLIAAARKGANAELSAALDRLGARLANDPVR